jgi:hypothetical protein
MEFIATQGRSARARDREAIFLRMEWFGRVMVLFGLDFLGIRLGQRSGLEESAGQQDRKGGFDFHGNIFSGTAQNFGS